MKNACVYILASKAYGTFYVGMTSDINIRMSQHDQGVFDGFTKKYRIKILVYYESHESIPAAIAREKLLKRWRREWKYRLIEQMNPEWRNLYDPATGEIAWARSDAELLAREGVGDLDGSPPVPKGTSKESRGDDGVEGGSRRHSHRHGGEGRHPRKVSAGEILAVR